MRLLAILAILLAFPALELYLLIRLGAIYGWWLGGYLLFMALAGWLMIMEERLAVFGRLFHILQSGHHPVVALFASARKMIAALLLMFPGVVSDGIAVLLLLAPVPAGPRRRKDDGVIEGEWERED